MPEADGAQDERLTTKLVGAQREDGNSELGQVTARGGVAAVTKDEVDLLPDDVDAEARAVGHEIVESTHSLEGLTEGGNAEEGEIEGIVAIGRRFGRVNAFTNLVFGSDFESNERDGEVRLGGIYTVSDHVNVGLDARARFDLGSVKANLIAF